MGVGFRVSGFGFLVSGFGLRASGFEFRVSDFEFRDDLAPGGCLLPRRCPEGGCPPRSARTCTVQGLFDLVCMFGFDLFGVWGLGFGV